MGIKGAAFNALSSGVIRALTLNRASKLTCRFVEQIIPTYKAAHASQTFLLYCPNALTQWRAATYFTKEPETIAWIDSFSSDDVLYDVGANMGLYSLYAAMKGIDVIAFEPASENCALINRNLQLNGVADRVRCLNLALGDRVSLDYLFMPVLEAGAALSNVGEAVGWDQRPFVPAHRQAVLCYTLDEFVSQYGPRFPTHLKIDVDGAEPKVVAGATRTLADPRFRSLLIEINEDRQDHRQTVRILERCGLHRVPGMPTAHQVAGPEFDRVTNYIFSR